MNSKLKFLLSSLIILEGYVTASDCYCAENTNQIEQDEYLIRYNEYLDRLCKERKIDIDENRKIVENEKFLQNTGLRSMHYWISKRKLLEDGSTMGTRALIRSVQELLKSFEFNSWRIADSLNLPQVQLLLSLSTLKEKYPEIITIISEKDNITVQEFETYLKNKLYKLNTEYIIQIKKYSMQYSNNIEELEYKMKQETMNYYNTIKQIIDWLPIFIKNDLNLSEQDTYDYTNKIACYVGRINKFIAFDRNENDNVNIKEDNNFLYYNGYLENLYMTFENFNKPQNGKNTIKNLENYVSNNVDEFVYKMNESFIYILYTICYNINNYIENTTLSLSELRNSIPDFIPINYGNETITAKQFLAYLGNKLCLLGIKYSEKIRNKVEKHNGNKLELENILIQETKDMYNVLKPVATWLQNLAQQYQPNENDKQEINNKFRGLRNLCTVFTSNDKNGNVVIEENNDFKDYDNYVSALVAPLEVDSKNELLTLIQDKEFLKFVDDLYQAFSDLNMKIDQIVNLGDYHLKNIHFSPELIETINKLFPNNVLGQEDLSNFLLILQYFKNKISQLGTLQLCNTIQQCINEYKNNNDENELKLKIKHQIIKIYYQNVTPIKELLNKLLQEFVNKYDKNDLSNRQREKLLKLENIIPILGDELNKFATKYNIPVLAEVIKLLQVENNLEEILSKMPHDENGNIIENEDFLRKDFFDISDKLLAPIFKYNNKNNSTLNYMRYILFNFVYRINSIVDYRNIVSSSSSYMKEEETQYPEQIEYDNYNTWNHVSDDKFAPGFNYKFDRKEANQKMKEIAEKNGYKDIINENFVYINPNRTIKVGSGIDAIEVDTSKISMQELIILFKNKVVKEMVNVFMNILSSSLLQKKVDNIELKNMVRDEIIKCIDRIEHIYKTLEEFLTKEDKTIGDNNVIMNQIFGINGGIKSDNIDNLIKLGNILKLQKQGKSIREINKELDINVEKFLSHARRKVPQTESRRKFQ